MSSRRQISPAYEARSSVQAPGMMRHGSFPSSTSSSIRPDQVTEFERLSKDNEKLSTRHVSLRQEVVATQHDIQRLKAHIRSIQTESDIQIRIFMEKIARMEVDIRSGENLKKELQEAHKEAQSLVKDREELVVRIQKTVEELKKTRDGLQKVPAMQAELEGLRREHHRLRAIFEFEKGINMKNVEQLQAMEKNMVGMAKELEKLRTDVLNAESRAAQASAPYGGQYMNQDPSYLLQAQTIGGHYVNQDPSHPQPQMHNAVPYMNQAPAYPPPQIQASWPPHVDVYGRPLSMGMVAAGEGMMPYGGHVATPPPPGPVWEGTYDPSFIPPPPPN